MIARVRPRPQPRQRNYHPHTAELTPGQCRALIGPRPLMPGSDWSVSGDTWASSQSRGHGKYGHTEVHPHLGRGLIQILHAGNADITHDNGH